MVNILKDNKENVLSKDYNALKLIKFALPTICMMLFMGLYTITDIVFVSKYVSTDALAAINIVCPITNLVVGIGTMLASGGNAIISCNMGKGKNREAKEIFTFIVLVALGVGIAILLIGLLDLENIVVILGASKVLVKYCMEYLGILLLFIPANMVQTVFANLFVTAGKPMIGSLLIIGGGIINIVLDYVFIVVFNLGIKGAALGTGMGYFFPAITGGIYFASRKGTLNFCRVRWNGKILMESCINGSSEMVSQLANSVTTFLFNRTMLGLLGEDGIAAITIIIYSQFLLSTLFIGYSMGIAPIIGYKYGEKNKKGLKRVIKSSICIVASLSIMAFLGARELSSVLVGFFSKPDTSVYHIAMNGFNVFAVSFLFLGLNLFISSMFTALSNGKVSAILSFLRTFIFLTSGILLLPRILGEIGIWIAIPLSEGLSFAIALKYLINEKYNDEDYMNSI